MHGITGKEVVHRPDGTETRHKKGRVANPAGLSELKEMGRQARDLDDNLRTPCSF